MQTTILLFYYPTGTHFGQAIVHAVDWCRAHPGQTLIAPAVGFIIWFTLGIIRHLKPFNGPGK